ncbi:MAG: Ycf66 family protein [Leptolyngbyaceae bacterium]|nr:Ycf66 family protein [Leptolyngbyaceae bacterium]
MINFGGGLPFILGILLVLCGVALYALRSYRPQLARDHDIFFSAIAAVCGFILMFQGWDLNPILQLGYIATVGSAVFFAVENIRLRGITAEQAKRSPSAVDDDRPVSRNYDYEEDSYDSRDARYRTEFEPRPVMDVRSGRRIPASRSARPPRDEWDDYQTAPRRMPPRRPVRDERPRYEGDRYDQRDDERYDERPRRRLPRSPRRNPEPVAIDVSWDDTPTSGRMDERSRSAMGDRPPSSDDWSPSPKNYDDEAPVINVNYANYGSNEESPPKAEEDNSSYQNLY